MTTPPQYSPPSSMGGMFLHDKNPPHLTRLNSNSSDLGLNGGEGYLYGPGASNNAEHVLAGSYHGLSSPFDKESSGSTPWSRSQAKLNYASESYVKQQGGVSQAPSGANGGYPDLQDAIDALMKFSLSPGDNEPAPSNSNLGTISTTPHAATTGAPTVGATTGATPEPSTKADYSLDSDELWKDFPSLSHHSSVDHMDHFSDKEWPAGLSLSLEGTGLSTASGKASRLPVRLLRRARRKARVRA
ncbi:hypothetical protein Poli38472_014856 [Pythium oligandrum]|uniref:Uncharacterized protein n=1 Tax=Pythium oligandrum TaxID=41045 RepID=A0A8K1C6T7_PYTOL|nr:hypothetical protein Poli38472_014856 [Pythium oligandrum]|eukprot:TMW57669.1 hypothetical protein Poli38472_014856 [Pythium oligandrum]